MRCKSNQKDMMEEEDLADVIAFYFLLFFFSFLENECMHTEPSYWILFQERGEGKIHLKSQHDRYDNEGEMYRRCLRRADVTRE